MDIGIWHKFLMRSVFIMRKLAQHVPCHFGCRHFPLDRIQKLTKTVLGIACRYRLHIANIVIIAAFVTFILEALIKSVLP